MARKQNSPVETTPPETDRARGALDAATLAPWIAFWGWVALDSALAYRKRQAALEQTDEGRPERSEETAAQPSPHSWNLWSPGARLAMISAPVIALLGPLVLDRLTRRRKP